MIKILIADDEEHIRFVLRELLEEENYDIFEAENGKETIKAVKKHLPEVVLLDFKLPDLYGDEVLKEIKKINDKTKIIVITAYADIKKAVLCMKYGAYDYLTKPFNNSEILLVVKKAIKEYKLENELEELRKKILKDEISKSMMGESTEIKKVITQIELVAPSDVSVLIEGETGTGKEIVSKLIHKLSGRNKKPFVAVDCGAIPENLFESEIFGHERGAFTGAIKTHIGKFEAANGGTLFLDEISNLPKNMQSKLLRVLEEKKITRLGGKTPVSVDVRIIAASNKNIEEMVKNNEFRDDLYYRLNEYKIIIPPLRNRKEDIPYLINYFIKEFNRELNKKITSVDDKAFSLMQGYDWPGNVRELRNVIKRAVLTANGNMITRENISFINLKNNKMQEPASFEDISYLSLVNKIKIINKAIKEANGNKTIAAKKLGITRNQLYRILNKAKKQKIIV